jgi:hypothetical protein
MTLETVFTERWPFVLAFVWLPALGLLLWPRGDLNHAAS